MDIIRVALQHLHSPALVAEGATTRYLDLLKASFKILELLQCHASSTPAEPGLGSGARPHGPRVALMAEPGTAYVAGTMGTWLNRGIAVPLCLSHPDRSLQYVLEDAGVSSVLANERHAERMHKLAQPLGAEVHVLDPLLPAAGQPPPEGSGGLRQQRRQGAAAAARRAVEMLAARQLGERVEESLEGVRPEDGAVIIYTSGTTGNPKGALHTHRSLMAQVRTLCEAWRWAPSDRILHSLPLHHVHGMVNALLCGLYAGATVEMMPKFSPGEAWQRLMRQEGPITLFMGVPTMYAFLLHNFDKMPPEQQQAARAAAGRLRLAVSGSSACPLPIMNAWEALSGQGLLERYGMTETGMILGNPYGGERRPGSVGVPFPGVQVKLVGEPGDPPVVGGVRVKSEMLFDHYWGKPEATKETFDEEGWFITGDTAELSGDPPYYSLLGRSSVDIIKHGGFKISALQVESTLLEHPSIRECAVVGVPDRDYGEAICLLVAHEPGAPPLELGIINAWASDLLPSSHLPTKLVVLEALPRNAMGKVNKKELRKLVPA